MTRISGAKTRASDSVMVLSAPLLAAYAIEEPMPLMPATDDTLTTADARPDAFAPASSRLRAARTIWNGPMVLTPYSL